MQLLCVCILLCLERRSHFRAERPDGVFRQLRLLAVLLRPQAASGAVKGAGPLLELCVAALHARDRHSGQVGGGQGQVRDLLYFFARFNVHCEMRPMRQQLSNPNYVYKQERGQRSKNENRLHVK